MEEDEVKKPRTESKMVIHSDDEDEEAVLEMDVVVCGAVEKTELLRVQLPQRKKDVFSPHKSTRIRYKKKARLMELRLAADTQSGSYDKSKGGRLGRDSDSLGNLPTEIYDGRCFDNSNPLEYSLAFIKNGKFYLCPVDGSIELKRNLAHLNLPDKKKKENETEDELTGGESEAEKDSGPQTVRVKFARQETERQKKRREASALHRQSAIDKETWTEVALSTQEMDSVYRLLVDVCVTPPGEIEEVDSEAVHRVISTALGHSPQSVHASLEGNQDTAPLPLIACSEMPMHLQVRSLLLKAYCVSVRQACDLLSPRSSLHETVSLLRPHSHLVQGVWVVKSELLWHGSGMNEKRARLWRTARDWGLALIDSDAPLTRADISTPFRLSQADANSILDTLGEVDSSRRRWILRGAKAREEECEAVAEDDEWMLTVRVEEAEYWARRWQEIQTLRVTPSRPRRNSGKH